MPVKIKQQPRLYPLTKGNLKPGIIYEGSDMELYLGIDVFNAVAWSIGSNKWIDSETNEDTIKFREVDTVIEYK